MSALSTSQRRFLTPLSQLVYCNPFHPERIELEKSALGKAFEPEELLTWSRTAFSNSSVADYVERPNVVSLTKKADALANELRAKKLDSEKDLALYEDLVTYVLYYRWVAVMKPAALAGNKASVAAVWRSFLQDFEHFFEHSHRTDSSNQSRLTSQTPEHLFACLHQVRRAFTNIFDCILGASQPAARLRGMVWQSIFTHDMRRYRRSLYNQMADLATLVTGPSGTGKELVARAIALSQYLAFDADKQAFVDKPSEGFLPINLSALSPTLIESELFGHCRGAYTGAVADRHGWLESCPSHGAVFLDEIGELDPAIQVKLLRVVQSRVYCRLGETDERPFAGKIIAATNRDLAQEMHAGRFREDLYYRLCSDRIETPSLRDQIVDRPEALPGLVRLIAERVAGPEADALAAEVQTLIAEQLADYDWPGNIRELEQCVRNVLVRRTYTPRNKVSQQAHESPEWIEEITAGKVTADELLRRYCTSVYARLNNYEHTAKQLGIDRRTVRSKIDAELLERLRSRSEQ